MAREPIYQRTETTAPMTGARQQAFDNGAGMLAQGGAALGRGVNDLARGLEQRAIKIDEATVLQMDNGFAQSVSEIERGFLSAQGGNAVEAAEKAATQWNALADSVLGSAKNDRQRQMAQAAINRRRERWQGRYDSHLLTQTDNWLDTNEQGRMASLTAEAMRLLDGTPERQDVLDDLAATVGGRAGRKGLGAEAAQSMLIEAMSGVHSGTINQMIAEGDAIGAQAYMEKNERELTGDALVTLKAKVESGVLDQLAFGEVNSDLFDLDDMPEETVEVEDDGGVKRVETQRMGQPVRGGRVSSVFGVRNAPAAGASTNHKGKDIAVEVGTQVTATLSGVARIKSDPDGYGTYIEVDHGNGLTTLYAHLSGTSVRDGERVEQGQVIALSGGARGARGSGTSTGPHLHYGVRRNGQFVDPDSVGGDVSVSASGSGGGASRPRSTGLPASPDDVRDWAVARAQALGRGNDWRLIQRLTEGATSRLSADRTNRNVREDEAWRDVEKYLPFGDNAVTSIDQIPTEVVDRLSQGQRINLRRALQAEAAGGEDEYGTDKAMSDQLELILYDKMNGTPNQRASFANENLTGYINILTREAYMRLSKSQIDMKAEGNGDNPAGSHSDQIDRLAAMAGFDRNDTKKIGEYNAYRNHMNDQITVWRRNNAGRPVTPEVIDGFHRMALREGTLYTNPDRDAQGRRVAGERIGEGRAYQSQGLRFAAPIPAGSREEIVASLQARKIDPTPQAIQAEYNRLIFSGTN